MLSETDDQSKYLTTLQKLHNWHNDILTSPFRNGILFQIQTPLFRTGEFVQILRFLPTELVQIKDGDKVRVARTEYPRDFSLLLKSPPESVACKATLNQLFQNAILTLRPADSIKMVSKFVRVSGRINYAFKSTYYNRYINVSMYSEINKIPQRFLQLSRFTTQIHIGRPIFSVGYQILWQPERPYAHSLLISHIKKGTGFLYSCIKDQGQVTQSIGMKKSIRENWVAAVRYIVNNQLESCLELAWKTMINKTLIHTTLSSTGTIDSRMTYKLTPEFRFSVTAKIDHSENRYRFGTLFLWDSTSSEKK